MIYVFLHLAATYVVLFLLISHIPMFLCFLRLLKYYITLLAYHYFPCFSAVPLRLRQWSTGLQLESHLQFFYHSILRETYIGIHQTWKCHYVAHIIHRFIAFLRNAFANCQVQIFSLHIMPPSFFNHSVNQAKPVFCEVARNTRHVVLSPVVSTD